MIKSRLRILPLVIYLALIFFFSSRPYLKPPGPEFKLKDKVAHLGEYLILGVLLFEGIGRGVGRSRIGTFVFLASVGASIGAVDEILQNYIPGREMSLYDWLSDTIGGVAGSGIGVFFFMREKHALDSVERSPESHSGGGMEA